MHKHTLVQFVAPLAALGLLAFGSTAIGAEAGTKIASANLPRRAAPAPAPAQKTQPADESGEAAESAGTVSGAMVHVRSGPGTQFGVLTTLKQGDAVKIEATQTGWLTIAWPENAPLWIAKEGVQLKGAGAEREGTLKAVGALRNSASNKAETVTKLESGAKLTVLEEHNGWLKVKAPASIHAFISAKFVSTDSKKATAARPDAEPVAAASAVKPAPEKIISPATKETAKPKPISVAIAPKPVVRETAKPATVAPATAVPAPAAPVVEAPSEPATSKPQPARPAHGTIDEPKPAKPMPPTLSMRAAIPEPLSSAQPQPAPRPPAKPAPRATKLEGPEILIAEPPKKSMYLPPPAPAADFSEAPTPAPTPEAAPIPAAAAARIPEPPPTIALPPAPTARASTTVSAAAALHSGSGAVHLNDRTFNTVVGNKGLALVDFNATWCGPCRSMSPIVEAVANEMGSEAVIAKLDVDEAQVTAAKFGVQRIPCLIVFKDGREIERHYGVHEADDLKGWVRNNR